MEGQPDPGDLPQPSSQRSLAERLALWPPPLDLRLVGRTLLHAVLVGALAGFFGAAFLGALELAQLLFLRGLARYEPVRALGETLLGLGPEQTMRPWVLALLPAVGALASGLLTTRFAPEAAGGGGDATIASYHAGGIIRRRILLVKPIAAVLALGTGGSGGREGPTMQVGAALGALVARWLPTTRRERRILIVAGIAAGISAVFRTPLGAALLATEMLYRDDFEADALVPAVLASVVAYSVVVSIFGQTTLFGRLPRFSFAPMHLVLYLLLAIITASGGVLFIRALRLVQRGTARLPVPVWLRPAVGGLAMGLLGTGSVLIVGRLLGSSVARVGVFGGGYGVAQVALSGAPGLPQGWWLAGLFAGLFLAKMIATALTVGSGAAAGDFAPSVVMGGLLGGAFGHAAAALLHDPGIDPAAFALVGMGTFYGGIAHAPLSALVLVSELAGSYDLLVPMMLSGGVAFVALRHWTLYEAQPASKADSPSLREERIELEPGRPTTRLVAGDVVLAAEVGTISEISSVQQVLEAATGARRQRIIVLVGATGSPTGIVDIALLAALSRQGLAGMRASEAKGPFASVAADASLDHVRQRLEETGLIQLPVYDAEVMIGVVGELEMLGAYARAAAGS
jgi:CIC family chloride channel protein